MENYVQETFADIEDEFCDNSDYVELKQAESEAVQFEERVCEEDDEFSWPVDGDGGVIGGVLQLEEDESEFDADKNIECPDCDYRTNRRSNFNRHIKTVHNLVRHACTQCEKYFTDRCSLSRHLSSTHQKVTHKCDSCPFTATRMSNLKAHVRASHLQIKLQCSECDYKSDTSQTLKRHMEAKHSNRSYQCSVDGCEFKTGSKLYLKGHFSHVHEKSSHMCQEAGCKYASMTADALKYHIKTEHLGVRFTCEDCGIKVRSQSILLNHIKVVHLNVVQVCNICGHKCKSKSELNVHNQAEHLGIVHRCDQCDYQSKRKGKLSQHIKTVHNGVRHPCTHPGCQFQATTQFNLKRHVRIVHNRERVHCNYCDFSTSQSVHLKKHMSLKHEEECASEHSFELTFVDVDDPAPCKDVVRDNVTVKEELMANQEWSQTEGGGAGMESDCRLGDLVKPQTFGIKTQIGENESLSCQEETTVEETEGQTVETDEHHHDEDKDRTNLDQNVRNEESQHPNSQGQNVQQVDLPHVRNQVVQDDQDVRNLSEKVVVRCLEGGCEATFDTPEARQQHEEGTHGGKKFRCNLCNFSCLTHGGLYLHKNAVHLGIRFRCDKCSYEGTQEVNLKRHYESKHGNVLHCCKLCNVQTRVSYYAESHLKKKHGICDKKQFSVYLERRPTWPKDSANERETEEERQLEAEMEEEEEEDGSYVDPSELLEQSDLIEEDVEAEEETSSLLYPSVEMSVEEEDDLQFLHPNSSSGELHVDNGLKHKSPQFQCKKCDYVAQSSGTLTRHVSVVHKGVRWSCRLCGYVTTVKCSMVRHVQSIHQGWRYRCPFCTHESTQKGGLKYHIEKKHPGQLSVPKWSSLAPVKSRVSSQIPGIEHMDVNQMYDELSDEKTSQEQFMDPAIHMREDFATSEDIAQNFGGQHEETVSGGDEEREEEDGDSLEDTGAPGQYVGEDYDFTELYSRFTGLEDVSCDLCTYSTARMGNMRRHVLAVHQGVRFPCNLCNYRAPDKGSLLRHTRGVHQGIRYYCDFCPYSATQKGNLKKHQEMKHKDNNYSCMYCSFQVNWKGSFIKHLQNQHGDLMAAQGLGTTGETNPLLSFNVNTFAAHTSTRTEEEEEEEEEKLKTEEPSSLNLSSQEEEDEGGLLQPGDSAESYLAIKSQNMSPTDKELEGSKVVVNVKTDTSKLMQFKTEEIGVVEEDEEEVGEIGENGSSLNCSFQCPLCNYTANSSASLARHNGAVHKGIRWQCKDCDFITRDKSSLKRHRRNRHEGIRFKCNYCDYDAGQKGNIKSHMDRKHPEIPYDHTEFQEVKVEKSKYTRESKHEKDPVDARSANGVAMSQVAAGLLGFGGLNRFSAHLLQSLLQAKMREENTAFLSTDEDSIVHSSDKEEDQTDGNEEDLRFERVGDGKEEQEEERFQTPSPGPSLTSTPVKEQSSSLLLNALRSLPSSSSSPTLTPRKSLLDLLNINQNVLEEEEERDKIIVVPSTPASMSNSPQVSRGGRIAEVDPDTNGGLPCQECTFVARSQGTLFRHIQSVHRGVRFTCEYCDFVTIDKGSLKRHVNGQHKGLKHKCDFCDYENAQIGNVKKHIQTKHQNIVYQCPYCPLEAKHKWYLEQHVRKLHTDKLFIFDIKNVVPRAATAEVNSGFPVNPMSLMAGGPSILPPSLMLHLHPMAKFFVPEPRNVAQEDKDYDTATRKIEHFQQVDDASEIADTE